MSLCDKAGCPPSRSDPAPGATLCLPGLLHTSPSQCFQCLQQPPPSPQGQQGSLGRPVSAGGPCWVPECSPALPRLSQAEPRGCQWQVPVWASGWAGGAGGVPGDREGGWHPVWFGGAALGVSVALSPEQGGKKRRRAGCCWGVIDPRAPPSPSPGHVWGCWGGPGHSVPPRNAVSPWFAHGDHPYRELEGDAEALGAPEGG